MEKKVFYKLFLAGIFLAFLAGPAPASGTLKRHCLSSIRIDNGKSSATCVLRLDGSASLSYHTLSGPERIYVDLKGLTLEKGALAEVRQAGLIRKVRAAQFDPQTVRIVFEFRRKPDLKVSRTSSPGGYVLSFSGKGLFDRGSGGETKAQGEKSPVARPDKPARLLARARQIEELKKEILKEGAIMKSHQEQGGKNVLITGQAQNDGAADDSAGGAPVDQRQFPRWRVVIDAGHGGKDPGTSGKDGHCEKQYTLEIARRLAAILRKDSYYDVFLTRESDRFISLDQRTLIANRYRADIFVSIHINWSPNPDTRGISTYFLNWTNDEEANRVAARENQISLKRQKVARTQLGYILASLRLESKRDESLKLANYMEDAVAGAVRPYYPGEKDLGVKQALFYVLVGDRMPAVLTEVSFLSNRRDEALLEDPAYIDDVARGMAAGIENYFKESPARNLQALAHEREAGGRNL